LGNFLIDKETNRLFDVQKKFWEVDDPTSFSLYQYSIFGVMAVLHCGNAYGIT